MAYPEGTRIGIGRTDGFRYVAVEPPLSDEEIKVIDDENILSGGYFEQITDEYPNASQAMVASREGMHPDIRTETAREIARKVATLLMHLRGGTVVFDPEPVDLMGHHSTPFNAYTDRRQNARRS